MFILSLPFRFWSLLGLLLMMLYLLFIPFQNNFTTLRLLSDLSVSSHHILPATASAPYLKGVVSLKWGDTAAAEHFFYAALQTRHHILAAVALIHLWGAESKWQRMLTLVKTLHPLNAEIINQIPVEHLEEAELRDLLSTLQKRTPQLLLDFAFRLLAVQRFEEAAQWAAAVTDDRQLVAAQRIIGLSLFYQNRFIDAQKIFASLYAQTNGKNADLNYWYGRSLRYAGDALPAIVPLERAVALEDNGWYLYELGHAYIDTGRCQEARQVIEFASQISFDAQLALALQSMATALANC